MCPVSTAATPRSNRPGDLRLALAMAVARIAVWLSRRLLRRSGGVIGGRVFTRLAPDAAATIARRHRITLVSGTNGKSTCTAFLTAAHSVSGPVSTNADGANTPAGLVWTLATAEAHEVVLEVDEAWIPWAVRTFEPVAVVLLNLARDQLHRNPEVARLAQAWRDALPAVPVAIANADDPWVAWAAEGAQRQVWVGAGQIWDEDSLVCPRCGRLLQRDDGWTCVCGNHRPERSWTTAPGVLVPQGGAPLPYATLAGSGNLANAVMAVAAAADSGVDPGRAVGAVASVTEVAGRYATVRTLDREVRLMLAKNPASWRSSLEVIGEHSGSVLLAFNADGADGRDPSWLYDVDFDALRGRRVAVYGSRGTDLAVRLELAEVPIVGQYGDVWGALRALPPGSVDLLATYTAFQQARREFRSVV